MTAPRINIKEQDISTRVASYPGVYAGIVIPAPKGTLDEPIFVTSDVELLRYLTPNETVGVGFNMAFYSALAYLAKSNKLWVVRADNGSKYGGVIIGKTNNIKLTDVSLGSITAIDQVSKTIVVSGDKTDLIHKNDIVKISLSASNNGLYTVDDTELASDNTVITLVRELPSYASVDGTLSLNSLTNPEVYGFGTDELMLITGANQGAWGDDIEVEVYTFTNSPDLVKEPNAFVIKVYKHSTGELLENFTCSRDTNAKDGYGNNIYVEDVLQASNYIRVVDNILEVSSSTIKEQTTPLTIDGSLDGSVVTDTDMISAVQKLANKNDIPLSVIMDGGWTTPSYQKAIDTLCQSRKDCVSCLSTPFSAEDSSSYMTAIVNYRKTTLNLNSSYSALYSPHLKIQDRFNNRQIFVSPDGYAAAAISETASNYEIWFAPAGFKRGVVDVLDTKRRFTEGELDLLYDSGVNPIKFSSGKGIAIWGQKTLSSRPSALDRLNVRLLLTVVEPAVASFLEDFLFEFNDEFTRLLVRTGVNNYMDGIKSRKGVYDYSTVCDETNNTADDIDNNKLNVWLFVQPTKVAEFITLSLVITRTGFDLSLAQGLLG